MGSRRSRQVTSELTQSIASPERRRDDEDERDEGGRRGQAAEEGDEGGVGAMEARRRGAAEKWQNLGWGGLYANGNRADVAGNRPAPALLESQKGLSSSGQGRRHCDADKGGVAVMDDFCMIAY